MSTIYKKSKMRSNIYAYLNLVLSINKKKDINRSKQTEYFN